MRGVICIVAALTAAPLAAQDVERVSGDDVAVYNLVGRVDVVSGSGPDVVVRVARGGGDANDLRVETGRVGGRNTLRVVYPGDVVVYPAMGRGSQTTRSVRANGAFSDGGGGGDRVRIRGSGTGLEAWADLTVEVPPGKSLSVYLAVGEVEARGVRGDLEIDTGSGRVGASDIVGSLIVDTGSGSVSVRGLSGDLSVDTGSGGVDVSEVTGEEIEVDTGSGSVSGRSLSAESLVVDTGSGRIELEGVSASDIVLDTGSGSVDIELLSAIERLEVDTGSGSVTVRAPAGLDATLDLDSGSGGIDVDFPVEVRSARRDSMRGRVGNGAGEIEIETGSGSIRLLRTAN